MDIKIDYVLISNCSLWLIENGQLRKSKIKLGMSIDRELKVYSNDSFAIASCARFENYKWNFYDNNNQLIDIDNYRMAVSGNYNIKPVKYVVKNYEESDETIIKNIIGVDYINDLKWYKKKMLKICLDFDNDGINETLYTMDNFIFGPSMKEILTFMFLEKNGKIVDSLSDRFSNIFNIVEILNINGYLYLVVLKELADPISYRSDNWFLYKVENNQILKCINN